MLDLRCKPNRLWNSSCAENRPISPNLACLLILYILTFSSYPDIHNFTDQGHAVMPERPNPADHSGILLASSIMATLPVFSSHLLRSSWTTLRSSQRARMAQQMSGSTQRHASALSVVKCQMAQRERRLYLTIKKAKCIWNEDNEILVPDCSANRCGKTHRWIKISLPPEGNMNKCYEEPAIPIQGRMNLFPRNG